MRYLHRPADFREEIRALEPDRLVVIDEIQKVPALLNEVHFLIQEDARVFVMCGSSARKVRHGHANLLGGRALRYELFGLSSREIGPGFSLEQILTCGPLPGHYDHPQSVRALQSYVNDYLREEIMQEGLVRRLPEFSDFLRVAAVGDTELVNYSNIARETGVSVSTVRDHYTILVDTLMGAFLPAYTKRAKRRTVCAPKFYFRDLGVVNHLTRRGRVRRGSEIFGKAFENWLFHELSLHAHYSEGFYGISYWRTSSGMEVDFVLGQARVAIEAKGKAKITRNDFKHLLQFKREFPKVKKLIVVSLEPVARLTAEGILILPYREFLTRLWQGKIMD